MKKVNFITNQDRAVTSGGWSGISYNIFQELQKSAQVNYVGPINPSMNIFEKSLSKALRSIGLKGNFSFYSENRLNRIDFLTAKSLKEADYNLFFGQTPWIKCNYEIPYGVYMDADFLTYMEIYSNPDQFNKRDLIRIAKKEEEWLQKAKNIFVGSQWTWDRMTENYNLNESQKVLTWTGGNVEVPYSDSYQGDLIFTFISLDFEKKGGRIVMEVFKKIKKSYPAALLIVIGQKPPNEYLQLDGVIYEGVLRKTNTREYAKFKSIIAKSFLMIHPTIMDTMGAVIIESGYFGCPTIAPRSFGIPELIIHNKTGIVVEVPFTVQDFHREIVGLIGAQENYLEMRKNVRRHTTENFTWQAIGNKIKNEISKNTTK